MKPHNVLDDDISLEDRGPSVEFRQRRDDLRRLRELCGDPYHLWQAENEAFPDMLMKLTVGGQRTLTEAQRRWVLKVHHRVFG